MVNTKNTQIEGFLRYYLALDLAPQYAVMVRGQWGSGKTFFMERQLERYRETGGKALYVSLYGIASVKEIEEEFFRQLHPVLASKGMAVASKVARGLIKATLKIDFGDHGPVSGSTSIGVPDISLPEYLKNTTGMLLVFDDLERCVIPLSELLGYINYFVEHDGYKDVLIANEKEILDRNEENKKPSTDYARIREKLIGKTFEVEADLEAAIQSFIPEIESDPAREQITRNLDNVCALYETSGYRNLRHLRQALMDFARVFDLLEEPYQQNNALTSHLLTLFLVYSFEMKSGNLSEDDLRTMGKMAFRNLLRSRSEAEENAARRVEAKYAKFVPRETLLPDSMWASLMSTGLVDQNELREAVRNSGYFPKEESEWVRLWNFTSLEDEQAEGLIAKVSDDFNKNAFREAGVLLHVTGALLMMASLGVYRVARQGILRQAIANVDALRQSGDLRESTFNFSSGSTEGFAGLGFQSNDSPELLQLKTYLRDQIRKAQEDAYPGEAARLLELVADDPEKFVRSVTQCNHADSQFYSVPILMHADPQAFVAKLVDSTASAQWLMRSAFRERYQHDFYLGSLVPEADWLVTTSGLLASEVAKRTGKLSADRLNTLAKEMANGAEKLRQFGLKSNVAESIATVPDSRSAGAADAS
ncbi:P-loop NTPase fold protein [Burkholderia pyrrocinia]|uniref:P-loop NTPase fold protein n=1 Tax=Burkholderia pyrrocinia TaxID=60550 RepID=UPI002AB19E04|nr:P-loop NTPase fold protein [Burkholderia pyrrocinia]